LYCSCCQTACYLPNTSNSLFKFSFCISLEIIIKHIFNQLKATTGSPQSPLAMSKTVQSDNNFVSATFPIATGRACSHFVHILILVDTRTHIQTHTHTHTHTQRQYSEVKDKRNPDDLTFLRPAHILLIQLPQQLPCATSVESLVLVRGMTVERQNDIPV